jgi:hypothetical protein
MYRPRTVLVREDFTSYDKYVEYLEEKFAQSTGHSPRNQPWSRCDDHDLEAVVQQSNSKQNDVLAQTSHLPEIAESNISRFAGYIATERDDAVVTPLSVQILIAPLDAMVEISVPVSVENHDPVVDIQRGDDSVTVTSDNLVLATLPILVVKPTIEYSVNADTVAKNTAMDINANLVTGNVPLALPDSPATAGPNGLPCAQPSLRTSWTRKS